MAGHAGNETHGLDDCGARWPGHAVNNAHGLDDGAGNADVNASITAGACCC